jgi:hypothetical protein
MFDLTDRSEPLDQVPSEMAAGGTAAKLSEPVPCPQCGHSMPDGCRCPGVAGILGLAGSLFFLMAFWWSVGLVLRWIWG